jgi:predicted transcriptional regulator
VQLDRGRHPLRLHYLKEFFQIVRGDGMAQPERVVRLTDPRALRALAHPTRVALLDHLLASGARTASECAAVVGESASSCSWHLRQLARFGFVERTDSADGRERPWRAIATGFGFEPGSADESLATAVLLTQVQVEEQALRQHLNTRDRLPPPWRDASIVHTYHLLLTPAELAALELELDRAIRPLIAATRVDPPGEARPVRLHLRAFPGQSG